jgi:hypothetical protein
MMRAIGIKNILNEVRMSVASTHSRKSTNNSHKSTKLTTIQRATPSRPPDCRLHFRTLTPNHPDPLATAVRTSAVAGRPGAGPGAGVGVAGRGMNENFLFLRKENHLNTQFNLRKNKLKEITKANKQLYRRLNTQKSFYSNSDLSKSYESTQEIKERLSQSKLSHRLHSSRSSKKSLRAGEAGRGKKEVRLEIRAKNISGMGAQEVNKFKGLFIRDINAHHRQLTHESEKEIVKFNSYRKNEYVIKNKASARMSVQPKDASDGAILHRVAELLEEDLQGKENQQVRQRKGSLVMPKGRKMFNF